MYPYLLMIFVVIFYAGNILVGKAINEMPPFTMSFFRLLFAFLLLFPIGFRSIRDNRRVFIDHWKPFLLLAFTGVSFFNVFLYGALQFTTTTKVSVLEAVIPAVTVILSAFLLKERLQASQWTGVVISLIGALCVVTEGKIIQLASGGWNVGDGLMIGAILLWSVYSIGVKKYMHLFPHYGAVCLMSGLTAIALLPFVLVERAVVGVPSFSAGKITGLLYLGTFPSVLALIFYNRAVEMLGPSRASVFLNFLPVVTMIGAYFWLNETIALMQVAGAITVIAGIFLTTRERAAEKDMYSKNQKCS